MSPADTPDLEVLIRRLLERADAPAPLLLRQPEAMRFVGLKRTAWFEALGAGLLPNPVTLNNVRYWRRSDLEAFTARLKPARRRVQSTKEPAEPGREG
jgi:predicted DNA-binding transcriptional regulator AlpA